MQADTNQMRENISTTMLSRQRRYATNGPVVPPAKIASSPRPLCPLDEDKVLHQIHIDCTLDCNGFRHPDSSSSMSPSSISPSSAGSQSDMVSDDEEVGGAKLNC